MKKYIGYVIAVVIGGIITAGFGVAAYTYNASNIEYNPSDKTWKVSTVAEAINSLVNDTKGSIINYSEEEQVVGKWIDDKPVYQKTITGTSFSFASTSWTNLPTSYTISNIKEIIFASALRSSDGAYTTSFFLRPSANGRIQYTSSDTFNNADTLIIQYTKTTDTGSSNNG